MDINSILEALIESGKENFELITYIGLLAIILYLLKFINKQEDNAVSVLQAIVDGQNNAEKAITELASYLRGLFEGLDKRIR